MRSLSKALLRLTTLILFAPLGCASEAWNLDRYRDERAKEIDARLSSDEPIIKNPFSQDGEVR